MALGDAYITPATLKPYLGIDDTDDDTLLTSACTVASDWINRHCARQFNKTTSATARVYRAEDPCELYVHDFHTVTDLVVKIDTADNGTYDTTLAASDYLLEPFDGIESQMTGFPYRTIRAVGNYRFPISNMGRPRVQVTAQWGWTAIPESVTLAAKLVAAYDYNLKSSPLGVQTFGVDSLPIRVSDVPGAARLLAHYQHPSDTVPVG
jgi:hypothetical protein